MRNIAFTWEGSGRLVDALKGPFAKVSTPSFGGEALFALRLWPKRGCPVTIYSEMRDISDREEVGILKFIESKNVPENDRILESRPEFLVIKHVLKLSVSEDTIDEIDCGVILEREGRDDIVILAGSFPCSIATEGIPGIGGDFEPEYPIARYRRAPLA